MSHIDDLYNMRHKIQYGSYSMNHAASLCNIISLICSAIKPKEAKVVKSETAIETEKQTDVVTESETTEVKAQVVQENTVVTKEAVQETVTNVTNGGTFEGQFVHATGKTVSATSVTTKESHEVTKEATTVTVVRIVLNNIWKFSSI